MRTNMHTPIRISVDEIIHTFEHPYCGDLTCLCNAPLSDANAEAVAHMMTIERGMSLLRAFSSWGAILAASRLSKSALPVSRLFKRVILWCGSPTKGTAFLLKITRSSTKRSVCGMAAPRHWHHWQISQPP